jgi:hypothetical protein
LPVVIVVEYGLSCSVRNVLTCTAAVNATSTVTRLSGALRGMNPTTTSITTSSPSATRAGRRTNSATLGRVSDSEIATPTMNARIGGTWLRACDQCDCAAPTPSSTTLPDCEFANTPSRLT